MSELRDSLIHQLTGIDCPITESETMSHPFKSEQTKLMTDAFFNLEDLLKNETTQNIDSCFLDIYLTENISLGGLWLSFKPPFLNDEQFCEERESFLKSFSAGLINCIYNKRKCACDSLAVICEIQKCN